MRNKILRLRSAKPRSAQDDRWEKADGFTRSSYGIPFGLIRVLGSRGGNPWWVDWSLLHPEQ